MPTLPAEISDQTSQTQSLIPIVYNFQKPSDIHSSSGIGDWHAEYKLHGLARALYSVGVVVPARGENTTETGYNIFGTTHSIGYVSELAAYRSTISVLNDGMVVNDAMKSNQISEFGCGYDRDVEIVKKVVILRALALNFSVALSNVVRGPNSQRGQLMTEILALVANAFQGFEGEIDTDLYLQWMLQMSDVQVCAAAMALEKYEPASLDDIFNSALPNISPTANRLDLPDTVDDIRRLLYHYLTGRWNGGLPYRRSPLSGGGLSQRSPIVRNLRQDQAGTSNMKILTIGIPAGFEDNIRSEYPISTGDELLGSDGQPLNLPEEDPRSYIKIKVYKIDLEYPMIIFKPKIFYFNMHEYVSPARIFGPPGQEYWNNIKDNSHNHSLALSRAVVRAKYIPASWRDQQGIPASLSGNITTKTRFSSPQRIRTMARCSGNGQGSRSTALTFQVVENHVIDFLLRMYIKTMTGADITETTFPVFDSMITLPEPEENIIQFRHIIQQYILNITDGVLDMESLLTNPIVNNLWQQITSASPTTASVTDETIDTALQELTGTGDVVAAQDLKTFLGLFGPSSMFSGGARIKREIISPKKFDRVFHVIVDPDDFEIDTSATAVNDMSMLENAQMIVTFPTTPQETKYLVYRSVDQGMADIGEFFVTAATITIEEVEQIYGNNIT